MVDAVRFENPLRQLATSIRHGSTRLQSSACASAPISNGWRRRPALVAARLRSVRCDSSAMSHEPALACVSCGGCGPMLEPPLSVDQQRHCRLVGRGSRDSSTNRTHLPLSLPLPALPIALQLTVARRTVHCC
ncbi:uncharacterized protein DMAD_00248 [Drosophila madeirensis]|uniref:Uncharacterized protein n=1 Tax=Drosophila madeirensis TaxID=30013 RepID=A0AAU9FWV1_DROMD